MTNKPHVIFIIIDSCSAKHTTLGGNSLDTTPNLTKFSKEDAMHFSSAYSHGPISGISIASFTTSTCTFDYPSMPIEVGPSRPSIARVLRDVGYHTALFSSNPYYAAKFGFSDGVDAYRPFFKEEAEIQRMNQQGFFTRIFELLNGFLLYRMGRDFFKAHLKSAYMGARMGKSLLTTRQSPLGDAGTLNKEVFRVIKERPKDKPLFMQVQYMDLHAPNLPPDSFLTRLGTQISKAQQYVYWQKRSMRPIPEFSEREVKDLVMLHHACLAHIDARIQELFNELKRQGMYDNALIIVTADHGEAFFEHGDLGHHALLYEENIRVPLLIKFPDRFGAGNASDRIVSQIDIAPTVLEAAGVDAPPTYVGKTLRADQAPRDDDHAVAFTAARYTFENVQDLDFNRYQIALCAKEWKLIMHYERPAELYHLSSDPAEQQNLLQGDRSREVEEAHDRLRAMLKPYMKRIDIAAASRSQSAS